MFYEHTGSLHTDEHWIKRTRPNGSIEYFDHLGGFDANGNNTLLSSIPPGSVVYTEYLLDTTIKQNYPNIELKFSAGLMIGNNGLEQYPTNLIPDNKKLQNFLCNFNYGYHYGRGQLIIKLFELGWFNFDYCTKGFTLAEHDIDPNFAQRVNIMSMKERYNLSDNIKSLSPLIQPSFVQVVSETLPDSYVPFPTEKMLFPIANKTLWVAYAQPGYHAWVEKYFGFKRYSIFDYSFDQIQDPTDRLDALVRMLKPFSNMPLDLWQNIYLLEQETIEFNFKWAQDKKFIQRLKQFDEVLPKDTIEV